MSNHLLFRLMQKLPVFGMMLLPAAAGAQVIKGTVTGEGSSLPGASVSVAGTAKGVATDLNGQFTLDAQQTGKLTLKISYTGFTVKELQLDVKAGINNIGSLKLLPTSGQLGEVVVNGTMAPSQIKALSIKKNALGIMEVMAADAIGKLPDRNAAEAVQRMQGVAVARYHGEADAATVRGTPFAWTSTLFNGTRMPSANVAGSRAAVLDAVPSEMIQYVQVSKAITPDIEGDAIGGSINFITRTAPAQRTLNVSAAGGYNTFSKDGSYNGSLVYGDRFFNGKLGVMLAGAIWDRQWGTDSYDVSYNTGLANAVQQKSINTVMFKRYMGKRQTYGSNLGLEYKFNGNHKVFFRGLLDKFNDIRPVYESYVDYTNRRYQYNYRYSHYQTKLNSFELGGEHQLGKRLNVDWSVADNYSKFFLETPPTSGFKGLPIATFRQRITGGFNGLAADGMKYWSFDSPDGTGDDPMHFNANLTNPAEIMDPTKLTLQQMVISKLDTEEHDQVAQLNFKLAVNSKLSFKAGAKYRHKERTGNYGANKVYISNAALGVPNSPALLTLSQLQTEKFPNKGNFFSNMENDYSQYVMNPLTKDQLFNLYDTAALRANGMRDVSSASNATSFYEGYENVTAGYVMAEYDVTSKLKMIAGVRNEYTQLKLSSNRLTTSATGSEVKPVTVTNNYNALLPMLHLKYALSEQANLRAAFTRTFVRPNFPDMSPGETTDLTKAPATITKGNASLKPTFSNNFDVMGEYYFKNIGLISGGVFYKDIKDVIFSDRSMETIEGTSYMVAQPKNLQDAYLVGAEAGISKRLTFLPGFWSGFGVEFNYTFIHSEVKVPRLLNNETVTSATSLPNQSKNIFNAILFYERNGVMVRLAGNYRGKSLETINQQLGPDFYIWTDKNFTLDASATASITKRMKVFVELNNLTNEPLRTYMGDKRRITMLESYGLRGQAGLRWDIIK
ncbi:TonB-dependent receptor [Chitinophaga horti]|uniref:TonB-dependent receptor n=1 Tax=Chitinophaga horti TaxID=2920382 RepID=A0ABY6J0M8_9BACT|nr:TonB-dependent receptor [Chitinophaga horti]UYQ91931.1 TonB-dependent receptor [Chitinophaga horti]